MAFVWSPLTATATRNLPPELAGASSAVYNSVRQLGAVFGSAGMAAFMTSRISAEMPPQPSGAAAGDGAITLQLPAFLREPFATAMSQSVLLPAFIALFGIVAALFLVGFAPWSGTGDGRGDDPLGPDNDDIVDDDYDDDEYVELVLLREPDVEPAPRAGVNPASERRSVDHPRPAPSGPSHSDSVDSRRGLVGEPAAPAQPIGFTHNGFQVDSGKRYRQAPARRSPKTVPPVDRRTRPPQRLHNGSAGHHFAEGESLRGRRPDPDDDPTGQGRHSPGS
jgi:hypothetical protein